MQSNEVFMVHQSLEPIILAHSSQMLPGWISRYSIALKAQDIRSSSEKYLRELSNNRPCMNIACCQALNYSLGTDPSRNWPFLWNIATPWMLQVFNHSCSHFSLKHWLGPKQPSALEIPQSPLGLCNKYCPLFAFHFIPTTALIPTSFPTRLNYLYLFVAFFYVLLTTYFPTFFLSWIHFTSICVKLLSRSFA